MAASPLLLRSTFLAASRFCLTGLFSQTVFSQAVFSQAVVALTALTVAFALTGSGAFAQAAAPRQPASEARPPCGGLSASARPPFLPAAAQPRLAPNQAQLTYAGHSTFLIESPQQVRIATDYNDYVRTAALPDIATMNHTHRMHYTDQPDPDIKFVLQGWRPDGQPAAHDMKYADVHVRSISTGVRDAAGGTRANGNSIFVFEVGSLCIAHLGDLADALTGQQLSDLGHIDVLLVPVDAGLPGGNEGMMEVVKSVRAPLMVPMHYADEGALNRFLQSAGQRYDVEFAATASLMLSKTALPTKGKFLVLPGR